METYNFIDLFAGCGGLSEGFYREGFKALLHLEIDPTACETLRTRMRYYGYSEDDISKAVMCDDITRDGVIKDMDKRIVEDVDVIIGGPPCQAFSTVGRAQDPNSMNDDPRNYLFESYIDILNHFKPKMFIFENVKGLLTAKPKGIRIFDLIISKMRETYNVVDNTKVLLLNSVNYGVPQMRERVIIIGVRKDIDIKIEDIYSIIKKTNYSPGSKEKEGLKKYYTVKDAIYDLPKLLPGCGVEEMKRTRKASNEYLSILNISECSKIFNHSARNHNEKDRERYKLLSKNKWQLKDLQKVRPDLIHHDPKHFGNRYTVQVFDKPGKTIVAHLYKDGNLFIHPDSNQERTFTVREAARIQSFPDDFRFEGSRTQQFKQVGNAVPPLLAQACAIAIKKMLKKI